MIDFEWKDKWGDSGRLQAFTTDGGVIAIRLDDNSGDDDDDEMRSYAAHDLAIPTARALHAALGQALEEVEPKTPLPSDRYMLECGHFSPNKRWCITCMDGVSASQPEPPPVPEACETCFGSGWQVNNHAPRLLCECGVEPWVESDPEPSPLPPDNAPLVLGRSYICDGSRAITVTLPPGTTLQQGDPTHEIIAATNSANLPAGPSFRFVTDGSAWKIEDEKPQPTLHPRPFFWESNMCNGPVNCPEGTWGNRMTLEQLLQFVPNALDGKETHHPQKPGCPPLFGFRLEHDGPRTLREYLEAP